jgi:hypothetical protein
MWRGACCRVISANIFPVIRTFSRAGGIVAANYLYNVAKPDGLTILAVNRANYLDQMVGRPEVKLDFRKLNWIGSFNRAPMPNDRSKIIRDAFEKTLADLNFIAEAKKLLDWDSTSYLSGVELQKRIEKTVTQPPDVIKRIKEILQAAG